jgi:hypothetical protein
MSTLEPLKQTKTILLTTYKRDGLMRYKTMHYELCPLAE